MNQNYTIFKTLTTPVATLQYLHVYREQDLATWEDIEINAIHLPNGNGFFSDNFEGCE